MSLQKSSYNRTRSPIESSTRALQILKAADDLLAERGHDDVSMRDVAQRAGVNKALIFYYFGSRAQLFDKVLERYYNNHAKALAKAFSASGPARERVHRGIDAYVDFVDENPLFSRLVQQEVARLDGHLPQVRDNLSTFYKMLKEELSEILPKSGPLASRHFFVSFTGLLFQYNVLTDALPELSEGDDVDAADQRREHIHWLADAVFDKLQAAA